MTNSGSVGQNEAVFLRGNAYERGREQAAAGNIDLAAVRASTVGRIEKARNDGLLGGRAESYLRQQWEFHEAQDAELLQEVRGIAEAFALDPGDLFAHLHFALLERLKQTGSRETDGCSTWAVSASADGPLLAKNRDTSGPDYGTQRVFFHEGPDVGAGTMLCIGSLGNPGAYSSGINAWGFVVADTHVIPPSVNVGWHRYFLMTKLLMTCRTVGEALGIIEGTVHAGGGTLMLADSEGGVAAVDFSGPRAYVTRGTVCWRTNHYPGTGEAPVADAVDASSTRRFAFLERELPGRFWSVDDAKALMASHVAEGPGSLCQHREKAGSVTLSTAIYACRSRKLTFSHGNPCSAHWGAYELEAR